MERFRDIIYLELIVNNYAAYLNLKDGKKYPIISDNRISRLSCLAIDDKANFILSLIV